MRDEAQALREKWNATGALADEVAFLRELLRRGLVGPGKVAQAADLGHLAARGVAEGGPPRSKVAALSSLSEQLEDASVLLLEASLGAVSPWDGAQGAAPIAQARELAEAWLRDRTPALESAALELEDALSQGSRDGFNMAAQYVCALVVAAASNDTGLAANLLLEVFAELGGEGGSSAPSERSRRILVQRLLGYEPGSLGEWGVPAPQGVSLAAARSRALAGDGDEGDALEAWRIVAREGGLDQGFLLSVAAECAERALAAWAAFSTNHEALTRALAVSAARLSQASSDSELDEAVNAAVDAEYDAAMNLDDSPHAEAAEVAAGVVRHLAEFRGSVAQGAPDSNALALCLFYGAQLRSQGGLDLLRERFSSAVWPS